MAFACVSWAAVVHVSFLDCGRPVGPPSMASARAAPELDARGAVGEPIAQYGRDTVAPVVPTFRAAHRALAERVHLSATCNLEL